MVLSKDGSVTGRGCSTKNQIFGTSCENHSMGGYGEEKYFFNLINFFKEHFIKISTLGYVIAALHSVIMQHLIQPGINHIYFFVSLYAQ